MNMREEYMYVYVVPNIENFVNDIIKTGTDFSHTYCAKISCSQFH